MQNYYVAGHFGRRVPDAQLLVQVRVEGFQKPLVEIGYRFPFIEAGEEGGPVHPAERSDCNSKPLLQPGAAQTVGHGCGSKHRQETVRKLAHQAG